MELGDILGAVGGAGGAGGEDGLGAVERTVLQVLAAQPGGVAGVLSRLQSAGLGAAVRSWITNAPNQPLSPEHVQTALGPGPVGAVADRLGSTPGEAAGTLAKVLPGLIDRLTPQGAAGAATGGPLNLGSLLPSLGL